MIKLVKFGAIWGMPSASPFCVKLETYLKMTRLPYTTVISTNLRKAPYKKLPYIVDNRKKMGDSRFIIDYLKQAYGDILDNNLTAKQKAQGYAVQRLLEEHFYWTLVYSRWMKTEGWYLTEPTFFGSIPNPIRYLISHYVRYQTHRNLLRQGLANYDREQVYDLAKKDILAITHILGDNLFILGEQPTSFDATCYAMLASLLAFPYDNPAKQYAMQFPNIQRYVKRMKERYYTKNK